VSHTESSTQSPSWYDVLDVDRTASADEVRAAWRSGIAELEPGSRRFASLNAAAEVLLDPARRASYDASLAEPEPLVEEDPLGARLETTAAHAVPAWLLAVVAVVLAALVAACGWAWQSTSGETEEEATRAAQAAAERAIVPVLSYGHDSLEDDQARAQGYLTSDYRVDYDKLFAVISENAPRTETTVQAEVVASGIVRSGQDRVDVLVFVDRPTTNKLTPEPEVYRDQVTVTMQRVGDEWLVDNLVTSPARG
jgi:Mce-associated membrane protein